MTIDVAQLKKISQSSLNTMKQFEENADNKRTRKSDDRFWKPTADEAGNGSALIRFLPALKAEQIPFVQTFSYFIKASTGNKWYVNKSRRTLNEADPMQEYFFERLNACATEDEKAKVKAQFRSNNYYIANILVLNDPAHPENNGKVFLYRFGKKLLNKITDKLKREFDGDQPVNVFDWMEGCNLRLRMTRVSGFPNYDNSEFQAPSALTDEQIQFCAEHMYDLFEFIDPSTFKSYDELKAEVQAFVAADSQGTVSPTASVANSVSSAPSGWTPSRASVPTTNTPTPAKAETAPWDDGFDSLLDDIK